MNIDGAGMETMHLAYRLHATLEMMKGINRRCAD